MKSSGIKNGSNPSTSGEIPLKVEDFISELIIESSAILHNRKFFFCKSK